MLMRYETSCFLQLFDDEPATPSQNRVVMARISELQERSKFKKDLSILFDQVICDHAYNTCPITAANYEVENVSPLLHQN